MSNDTESQRIRETVPVAPPEKAIESIGEAVRRQGSEQLRDQIDRWADSMTDASVNSGSQLGEPAEGQSSSEGTGDS